MQAGVFVLKQISTWIREYVEQTGIELAGIELAWAELAGIELAWADSSLNSIYA